MGFSEVGVQGSRGDGAPQMGPLLKGWTGDSRGRQVHSRGSLHFSVKHVAILASVFREQIRHFYSRGEATHWIVLLDKGLPSKNKDCLQHLFSVFSMGGVSAAQWERAIKPSSCFPLKQQLLGPQVPAQWSLDLRTSKSPGELVKT